MPKEKSGSHEPQFSRDNLNSINDKKISKLSIAISQLSYEDSLKELDVILNSLQNETLLVEDLQFSYVKAKLYLKHCEKLLDKTQQDVIEFDSNQLNPDDN